MFPNWFKDVEKYFRHVPSVPLRALQIGTYTGETEANLRRIFSEASHHSPSIILIDELDAMAPKRGETGAHADTRTVTQLLALMDGLKRVDSVIVTDNDFPLVSRNLDWLPNCRIYARFREGLLCRLDAVERFDVELEAVFGCL